MKTILNLAFKFTMSTLKAYWFIFYSLFVTWIIYVSFYILYLPTAEHYLDVHFNYKTTCEQDQTNMLCSFPSAYVLLHKSPRASKEGYRVLTRGQGYDVRLELQMPLSDENRKLGMFLVQIDFLTKNKISSTQSRSALLSFESNLLTSLKTVFYMVPLITGWKTEKQTLLVPLVENFIDNSYDPVTWANVTIHSKRIQIYSARLHFKAIFTGLRYYMFYWPVVFSLIGFSTTLSCIMLFLIYRVCQQWAPGTLEYCAHYDDLSDSSSGDESIEENVNRVETVQSNDGDTNSDPLRSEGVRERTNANRP